MAIIRNPDGSTTVSGQDSASGQAVVVGSSSGKSTTTPQGAPPPPEGYASWFEFSQSPAGQAAVAKSVSVVNASEIPKGNQLSVSTLPSTTVINTSGQSFPKENANIKYDTSTGRWYDPAADRILATLQQNNPNATPEQLAAMTQNSEALMPITAEYAKQFVSAQKTKTAQLSMAPPAFFFDFSKDKGAAPQGESGRSFFQFSVSDNIVQGPLTPRDAVLAAANAHKEASSAFIKPTGKSVEISVPKEEPLHGEAYFVDLARKENIIRDIPYFGEVGTTLLGGMKIEQGVLIGNPEAKGLEVKGFFDIAAGGAGLYIGGRGAGTLASGLVASTVPTIATVAKIAAVSTGFGAGIRLGSEGISSVSEGRQFNIERTKLSDFTTPEFQAGNVLIGLGTAGLANEFFLKSGMAGASPLQQQVSTGAVAGGLFGLASSATVKENVKPVAESALTGALMGGAFAFGGYELEQRGVRPVAEIVKVKEVAPGGVAEEKWLGFKVGVETVPTKPGGQMSFKGIALAEDYYPKEGTTLQPRGTYEAIRYTPELVPYLNEAAATYYSGLRINANRFFGNAEQVSPGQSGKILSAIREENGIITGSIAEKAIQSSKGIAGDMPGARGLASSDYDVQFFSESEMSKAMGRLGVDVVRTEVPITTKGYLEGSSKFTGTKGGVSFDITIPSVSAIQPSPMTPLGQFASSYSFSKVGKGIGVITASPQQLVAAKFMTIGIGSTGKVQPIEPEKSKYIADVNMLMRLGGGKDLITNAGVSGGARLSALTPPPSLAPSMLARTGTGVSQMSFKAPSSQFSPARSSIPSFFRELMASASGRSPISGGSLSPSPSRPSSSPPSSPSSPSSSSSPGSPSPPSSPSSPSSSSASGSSVSNFIASMRLPGIGGGFPSFPGAGQNKGEGISGSSKSKAAASVHSMLRTYEKAAPKPIKPRKAEKVRLTTKPMRWG